MPHKSYKRNEELIHKNNKTLYKFDMSYSPFLYHILNKTHIKKKHYNPCNFFPRNKRIQKG